MNNYHNFCPNCKKPIYLIGASLSCRVTVGRDGWDFSESLCMDTEEEQFICSNNCLGQHTIVPSEWVFKTMKKYEAGEKMRNKDE